MNRKKIKIISFLLISLFVFSTNIIFRSLKVKAEDNVYEVGPGKTYIHIYDVPINNLQSGDIVKVYAKPDKEPYKEKFMIAGIGTQEKPIQFIGIADNEGNYPVIDGEDAVSGTDKGNYFWNEDRGLVKMGQSGNEAQYITINGFEIKNANRNNTFTGDTGNIQNYAGNGTGIYVEAGSNITIKNCNIYGNENGIQTSKTNNLLVEYTYIHDNGAGSSTSTQEHNVYIGGGNGSKVTIQYSRFGELLNDGQQAKFRTETVIFRYNWVEGGKNSQLDIVDDGENEVANAYVYGNVLIKPSVTNNGRFVHYGQDCGYHNSGVLYFFNNTFINKSNRNVYLFKLSSDNRSAQIENNIFYKDNSSSVYLLSNSNNLNKINGNNNWFYQGTNDISTLNNNLIGIDPSFVNQIEGDYNLKEDSVVKDIVSNFISPVNHSLDSQYVKHLDYETRPTDEKLDLGAFEFKPTISSNWTLSVNKSENGSVEGFGINCGLTCTKEYEEGTVVVLEAIPENGWQFASWINCPNENGNKCTITMNEDKIISANFSKIPSQTLEYTLGVNINNKNKPLSFVSLRPGDSIESPYNFKGYIAYLENEENIKLEAIPGEEYSFAEWKNNSYCVGSNPICTIPIETKEFIVKAEFNKDVVIPNIITSSFEKKEKNFNQSLLVKNYLKETVDFSNTIDSINKDYDFVQDRLVLFPLEENREPLIIKSLKTNVNLFKDQILKGKEYNFYNERKLLSLFLGGFFCVVLIYIPFKKFVKN